MKKFIISAILLLVMCTSCTKESNTTNPLINSWKLDRKVEMLGWCGNETPSTTYPNPNEYLNINSDLSYVKLIGNTDETGTYRISGDTIFFDSNGVIDKKIYRISDDGELILRVIMPPGSYGWSFDIYVPNH